ncbi:unnamed protein product, partial [Bubo scandiacus]
ERKHATGSHSLTSHSFAKDRARSEGLLLFLVFLLSDIFVGEIEYCGRSFLKCVARITGVINDNMKNIIGTCYDDAESTTMADLHTVSLMYRGVTFLTVIAFLQKLVVLV